MDSYPPQRDTYPLRSPIHRRPSWEERERDEPRALDRPERRDDFYRGRSPNGNARPRRPARRSRSPVDRYESARNGRGDDYGPPRDRDERRRLSPPPMIDRYVPGPEPPPMPTFNPVTNPAQLQYQVGFSYFGEWWRANEKIKEERELQKTGRRKVPEPARGTLQAQEFYDKEKGKIQAAYDSYKEDFQAKMAKQFVAEHKLEQWFQERYASEIRDPLRAKINEFRRGPYNQWEQDLEAGVFDQFSLEGIPKSESNGQGGLVEKEEGEATATNEVLGVGDLLPTKESDIRDENAFQPTLLIKTIAPHVNREELEKFCKEHLGEEEGGFKWLSLSDPNPSKRYHRIGWVMLHPADETKMAVDRPDPREDEAEVAPQPEVAPQSTAEKALEAINGKTVKDEVRGDFTCHVGIHVPPQAPRKKALWDLFSAPERIEKDLELAVRLINKYEEDFLPDFSAVLKIEERVEELRRRGDLVLPITAPKREKTKKERNLDEEMDEGEEDVEEGEDEDGGLLDDEIDDEDLLVKKKQLDLMVEYLRRVFNFCFFCVFESDSIHELTRKCPGGHLRRPRNTLTTAGKEAARASAAGEPFPVKKRQEEEENGEVGSPSTERKPNRNPPMSKAEQQLQRAYNWVKTYEEKILQILEPDSFDVRKLGGEPLEEAVEKELKKFVKQEDEHKFRCRVPECTKLFKEEHFWRKHVEKRHPEFHQGIQRDLQLVNAYVSDPAHIAPSRSDANSNGHFPPANGHLPAGTPRGFNLQQFNGMPPMTFPSAHGFPAFFGGPPGGVGPMRQGSGRFQNQRSTPYDRNGGREQRFNGGRPDDPRASQRPGMAGRWDSASGGGAAVGPREAVQGRSLKSYEDLDAVGAGAGSELNY